MFLEPECKYNMYISIYNEEVKYNRTSKSGKIHEYTRVRRHVLFRCDCCKEQFTRLKENISPKRLNNNYFHCCSKCDSKKFAQKKGAEHRTRWELRASSEADISDL